MSVLQNHVAENGDKLEKPAFKIFPKKHIYYYLKWYRKKI